MIVLDTTVISEAMRPQPDPTVVSWLNAQSAQALFLSSVTLAELLSGIGVLPAGARQERLGRCSTRCLPFPGRNLATRNTRQFVDTGVELIDPWASC